MAKTKIRPHVFNAGHNSQQHNFFYRLFSSQRFLAVVGMILLFLIALPLAKTYSQKRLIEQEIKGVENDIGQFEKDNQELRDMIEYLKSDQSLESQARLNLNLKKPGETVVVIEDKTDIKNQEVIPNNTSEKSNFKKWFDYFFSR